MPPEPEHVKQVKRLSDVIDKRIKTHERVEPYYENDDKELVLPAAVTDARLTKVYRHLMPVSEAPWGSLIVDSKLDRLEVSGISDPENAEAAKQCWDIWQRCHMDSESKLQHASTLIDGRTHALVWKDKAGNPDIMLDDVTQAAVEFEEGSRHKRVAGLRRWKDDERIYATLYRPDGVFKYQGPTSSANTPASSAEWEKREVDDEVWPLPNIFEDKSIPLVELRVNGRLKPGRFPHARGEYAHVLGLIDRINLLTFLGLVVAFWMGFPLRGVIGEKIRREVMRDDEGNALLDDEGKERTRPKPVLDVHPDSFAQLENPDAKTFEWKAADRSNLSIFRELDELAVLTKTARHYFPLEKGMSNLSAEAIVASEGGMLAAVTGHKASLDDGHEEVLRLAGRLLDKPVELSPRAELDWKKHESRSIAEQADAFTKIAAHLPWTAAAELALNVSQDQISRWQSERAMDPIVTLLEQAQNGDGKLPSGVPTI